MDEDVPTLPPFSFPTFQTDLPKASMKDKQVPTLTESGSQRWIQAEGCHLHKRIKAKRVDTIARTQEQVLMASLAGVSCTAHQL